MLISAKEARKKIDFIQSTSSKTQFEMERDLADLIISTAITKRHSSCRLGFFASNELVIYLEELGYVVERFIRCQISELSDTFVSW